MFLGCGKRRKDGRKVTETDADNTLLKTLDRRESSVMISGQTLEMVPTINDLNKGLSGGKRLLEGGLDSPSKRARKYGDLKDFLEGRGDVNIHAHTPGTWNISAFIFTN